MKQKKSKSNVEERGKRQRNGKGPNNEENRREKFTYVRKKSKKKRGVGEKKINKRG